MVKDTPSETEQQWTDEEAWEILLEKTLATDPATADTAMELWGRLLKELQSRPEGVKAVSAELNTAMEITYPYTTASKKLFELTVLSLTGDVKPSEEPRTLIAGAIELANESIARAKRKRQEAAAKKPKRKKAK